MKIRLNLFHRRLLIQLAITFGIILMLSLAIFFFKRHINEQVSHMTKLRQEIAFRNHALELRAGSNSELARAEPLLKNLDSILPKKETLLAFSRDIKKYGQQFDVNVGFSFGAETAGTSTAPGTVNFALSATGEYESLVDFLSFLEQHSYFIHFDGISLSYIKDDQYVITTGGVIYTK